MVGRETASGSTHAPPAAPATDPRERRRRIDGLIDLLVRKYAPVPSATLTWLVARLRLATPQWQGAVKAALDRARRRLRRSASKAWTGIGPQASRSPSARRTIACGCWRPSTRIVWDRRRVELLWGWPYRFEASTPESRRRFGYYALPVLWRDAVVGWANVSQGEDGLGVELGYVAGRAPRDRRFRGALSEELAHLEAFLA